MICYSFIFVCSDEEGYITGFSKDLIATVCEAAGVDCRTVWDKWTNCWDSSAGEHSMGGKGKRKDISSLKKYLLWLLKYLDITSFYGGLPTETRPINER